MNLNLPALPASSTAPALRPAGTSAAHGPPAGAPAGDVEAFAKGLAMLLSGAAAGAAAAKSAAGLAGGETSADAGDAPDATDAADATDSAALAVLEALGVAVPPPVADAAATPGAALDAAAPDAEAAADAAVDGTAAGRERNPVARLAQDGQLGRLVAAQARNADAPPGALADRLDALQTLLAQQGQSPEAAVDGRAENIVVQAAGGSAAGGAAAPLHGLLAPLPARGANVAVAAPPQPLDVASPQAGRQIAETVVWHLGEGAQEAQIRLHPEDIGPLDVKLKLDGDKVSLRFDMADASVRDVVQSSLPNLATMLAARGLSLDQAQVFAQGGGQGQAQPQPEQTARGRRTGAASGEAEAEPLEAVAPRVSSRRGLVDDYV